ncbi:MULTISPECIES: hypothetical protein [unclassified Duganella]|uniref:hypothetical protein n=1 Tax=unclassified Duganella TaxID=2636909 RepID=UPI00088E85B9|nr:MULTISPECIES: hypothetical protein [unclassified Duganella]SDH42047.1 hypothetical protein SAMN05216320_11334 [Duganella sp. OV458]SDK60329.1 hypothetical protein SAMN05428973_113128 [Duganella sp. OV510]
MTEQQKPQTSLNETDKEMIKVLRVCGFHVRTNALLDHQRPQIFGPLDAAITLFKLTVAGADVGGADAVGFAPYLKDGETPLQRLQREIADSETLASMLAEERAKVATIQVDSAAARRYGYRSIAANAGNHCTCCNGNDGDAPCAYPSEGRPGCLRDIRRGAAEAGNHNSQNPNCSCPSGNGSLRWPCPIHPPERVRQPAVGAGDQRAEFEAAARRQGYNLTREANDHDDYAFHAARGAWWAWQTAPKGDA